MLMNFNNFTDSDGYTWSSEGTDLKIVNSSQYENYAEFDGKAYLFSNRTDISDFGLGKFTFEFRLKLSTSDIGNRKLFTSPLVAPSKANSTLQIGINQFGQYFIQVLNYDENYSKASGMSMTGIDMFDNKWHVVKCTRDRLGIIHWFYDGLEKEAVNTKNWSEVNITSSYGSYIGNRFDLLHDDEYKFKGCLDYLKITKSND